MKSKHLPFLLTLLIIAVLGFVMIMLVKQTQEVQTPQTVEVGAAPEASLSLDPASATISPGGSLTVSIVMDIQEAYFSNADILITFPNDLGVTPANFTPDPSLLTSAGGWTFPTSTTVIENYDEDSNPSTPSTTHAIKFSVINNTFEGAIGQYTLGSFELVTDSSWTGVRSVTVSFDPTVTVVMDKNGALSTAPSLTGGTYQIGMAPTPTPSYQAAQLLNPRGTPSSSWDTSSEVLAIIANAGSNPLSIGYYENNPADDGMKFYLFDTSIPSTDFPIEAGKSYLIRYTTNSVADLDNLFSSYTPLNSITYQLFPYNIVNIPDNIVTGVFGNQPTWADVCISIQQAGGQLGQITQVSADSIPNPNGIIYHCNTDLEALRSISLSGFDVLNLSMDLGSNYMTPFIWTLSIPTPTRTPTPIPPTPTRTPTPIPPTPTRTPSPTLMPTSTPTVAPTPLPVSTRARLQGITHAITNHPFAITITRVNPDGSRVNVFQQPNLLGNSDFFGVFDLQTSFIVPNLALNYTYDILVKSSSHLQKRFTGIGLTSTNGQPLLDISNLELLSGDIRGTTSLTPDNVITSIDLGAILSAYCAFRVDISNPQSSSPTCPASIPANYDVNQDGFITLSDVALVTLNYQDFVIRGQE